MYLNRMGCIRKRIKIPIFSKKITILAKTVLLLLKEKRHTSKNEKNKFCSSNDYGSKTVLISSKILVELNFGLLSVNFCGQNDWSLNFRDI